GHPLSPSVLARGATPPDPPPREGSSRYRPLLSVAVDDESDRDAQSDQHADREEQRQVESAPDQPADDAVGSHSGKQVAEYGPADVQALGPAFRGGRFLAQLSA